MAILWGGAAVAESAFAIKGLFGDAVDAR